MGKFLLIGFGGAIGTWARYLLSGLVLQVAGTTLPYGTLVVNIIGSFFMSIVMYLGLSSDLISPTWRIVLATGIMGGFTTYSSFSYETVQYFQNGEFLKGFANLVLMVCSCLIAAWIGLAVAKWLTNVGSNLHW
jgi:CrcB protein